jgi:cyclopropane fatty-acyl-phospholipid synthase-like methyltransferase
VQDYRDVRDGPYDAVASIGMAEHVGLSRMGGYAARLHTVLAPGGRLLNHAISRRPGPPGDPKGDKTSFIDRLAGSGLGFQSNRLGINQVLAVKPGPGGASSFPRVARAWPDRRGR